MDLFSSINDLLAHATKILRSGGIESARLDAEVLLAFVLNKTRTGLYIDSCHSVNKEDTNKYLHLVQRRASGEPIAYLTGEKEFMSLLFKVNQDVLIPRPETEMIVEEALEIKPLSVIDVGTGSGAIAVSIAYYLPGCKVAAVDISPEALSIARFNAQRHGVNDRINFYQGDLLKPIINIAPAINYDLITANLPYIPSFEMDKLPLDVKKYEPALALDGGQDGLKYYYELCSNALKVLAPGGILLLEIGYDQGTKLAKYLSSLGFAGVKVLKDLAGLDRIVKANRAY